MAEYRDEFERRVKAVMLSGHADHDWTAIEVTHSGDEGDACETCGGDPNAYIIAKGQCGCGERVYCDQNLASSDFGVFMQKITAD